MKKILIIMLSAMLILTACVYENEIGEEDEFIGTDTLTETETTDTIVEIPPAETDGPEIGIMTQEYIDDNIAEILMITYDGENPEIESINNIIKNTIRQTYDEFMENRTDDRIIIKSYPFTSDDYLQIITTDVVYPIYGTDGNITSYNFSKKENKYITLSYIMEKLELTDEIITENVKELYAPEALTIYIDEVTPKGFLIMPDHTLLLLEVLIENTEAAAWKYFYTYSPELYEFNKLDLEALN